MASMSHPVFFWSYLFKKKLFLVIFWSFFRREAPIFLEFLVIFWSFLAAEGGRVFFWTFLGKIVIFWSFLKDFELFFGVFGVFSGAKRRVFFKVFCQTLKKHWMGLYSVLAVSRSVRVVSCVSGNFTVSGVLYRHLSKPVVFGTPCYRTLTV